MNRDQVSTFLAKATSFYPSKAPDFKKNPLIFEGWVERMAQISFDQAIHNLNEYVDRNRFFPEISDILQLGDKEDREIELRNADLAFEQYVNEGGDPYKYPGHGTRHKKLGS